ncbi:hypothetical protein [Flammeovirga sp. EKP202]|uniref:hypothetical protein n=1 Tax=Flammeovirga sp. EKP202 TaxID=2770592 RepID=UPI00165EDB1F|nr:hypothetical protein [Flammeovirga sp. EKP202]MBD0403539.1 hypothetical protein [Flammeovirga sp. EKP202]
MILKTVRPYFRKFFFWFKLTVTLTSSSIIATAEEADHEFFILSLVEDVAVMIID